MKVGYARAARLLDQLQEAIQAKDSDKIKAVLKKLGSKNAAKLPDDIKTDPEVAKHFTKDILVALNDLEVGDRQDIVKAIIANPTNTDGNKFLQGVRSKSENKWSFPELVAAAAQQNAQSTAAAAARAQLKRDTESLLGRTLSDAEFDAMQQNNP